MNTLARRRPDAMPPPPAPVEPRYNGGNSSKRTPDSVAVDLRTVEADYELFRPVTSISGESISDIVAGAKRVAELNTQNGYRQAHESMVKAVEEPGLGILYEVSFPNDSNRDREYVFVPHGQVYRGERDHFSLDELHKRAYEQTQEQREQDIQQRASLQHELAIANARAGAYKGFGSFGILALGAAIGIGALVNHQLDSAAAQYGRAGESRAATLSHLDLADKYSRETATLLAQREGQAAQNAALAADLQAQVQADLNLEEQVFTRLSQIHEFYESLAAPAIGAFYGMFGQIDDAHSQIADIQNVSDAVTRQARVALGMAKSVEATVKRHRRYEKDAMGKLTKVVDGAQGVLQTIYGRNLWDIAWRTQPTEGEAELMDAVALLVDKTLDRANHRRVRGVSYDRNGLMTVQARNCNQAFDRFWLATGMKNAGPDRKEYRSLADDTAKADMAPRLKKSVGWRTKRELRNRVCSQTPAIEFERRSKRGKVKKGKKFLFKGRNR